MATPIWTPSTYYATGSLVQPATTQPAVPAAIPNPSFESGNVEWTLDAGLSIVNGVEHFGPGTWSLQANTGFAGERWAEMQDFIPCVPGESITATCQIQQGASSFGNTGGAVGLRFYDSLNALISDSRGNEVIDGSGGAWHASSVSASAPAGTASVRIYIYMKRVNQNLPFWADAVTWNKISQAQSGLIFRAVQPTVGLSDSVEPVWPIVNGAQVIDNEVIWEAVLATRITWEAHAILVSGATEPTFPAQEGGTVGDNTISWRAVSRRVTDPNCPNSKIVVIAASKVFAADDDIVAYSATVNPLDWSSANDAGYLPTNLQQYGANPVAGIGLYRSNLVPMNTQGSQVWQIDEDPAQMALLDAFPVGTAYHDAISPAFNDMFFLSTLGVRSLGIAGGSTNLQSGDAGMPIDPLVQEAVRNAQVNGDEINSLYYPAAGQYWLMFSPPEVPTGPIALSGDFDDATISVDYSDGPLTVANGFAPYRWEIESGTIPSGLTFNEFTGILSGTPDDEGVYSFVVRVTDRFSRTTTSAQSITVALTSDLFAYKTPNIEVRNGVDGTYSLISGTATNTPAMQATTADGSIYLAGYSAVPRLRVFERNLAGAYIEIPTPVDVVPPAAVQSVAISPDGTYLCFGSDTGIGIYKRQLDGKWDQIQIIGTADDVLNIKFSPDGNYLAHCGNAPFFVVRQRVGDSFNSIFSGGTSDGRGIAWSKDSSLVAFTRRIQTTQIHSVSGSTVTLIASSTGGVAPGDAYTVWTNDGEYIIVRGNQAPVMRTYHWNGITLAEVAGPPSVPATSPTSVSISANGNVLVSSNTAGFRLWDIHPGGVLTLRADIGTGTYSMVQFAKSGDYPQ